MSTHGTSAKITAAALILTGLSTGGLAAADWDITVSGPSTVTPGYSTEFTATIENVGADPGDPGNLEITKRGDNGDRIFPMDSIEPGENVSHSRSISFNASDAAASPVSVCAEYGPGTSKCRSITVNDPTNQAWRGFVNFEMDLTGPDRGLGWDDPDNAPLELDYKDNQKTVFTDIYWEGNYSEGPGIGEEHYPPLCGDDQREYLIEEIGESAHSERYEGRFSCADSYDVCTYRGVTGEKIFERGEMVNTDEPGEESGRLKQDEEVCIQRPGDDERDYSLTQSGKTINYDPVPEWYDQDYANNITMSSVDPDIDNPDSIPDYQNICRENTLWEALGVRWIDKDYIEEYPNAVTEGVDDSWNPRMDQRGFPSFETNVGTFSGDIDIDNNGVPVVPGREGTDRVAAPTNMEYGFCGGDDASEYLIYQESETRYLESDMDVIGVASDPDACVLENDRLENSEDNGRRDLYDEGDRVSFTVGDGSQREVACFGGAWWSEWPVVFLEDRIEMQVGETRYQSFHLINPQDTQKTYDLNLTFDSRQLNTYTEFAESGSNDMRVTLPPQQRKTYDIKIKARDTLEEKDVTLNAEALTGDIQGSDSLTVNITESELTPSQGTSSVPGLNPLQLIAAGIAALLYFAFRN